jgi:hypothetical protein
MSDTVAAQKLTMGKRIETEAINVLQDKDYADGIKVSDLKAKIASRHPSIPPGTIAQYVSDFATKGDKIRRLQRGVVALVESMVPSSPVPFESASTEASQEQKAEAAKEATFYEPFSKWLVNEAQEVTEAVALGGGALRGKWGTPDVIGVYKPKPSDLIKFPAEIVSIEIKTDPGAAITAFGQAISYRLFSHKTIIAMADAIEKSEDANSRLKSLCHLFGVGYVVFDRDNVVIPNFRLVVPPRRFDPDMDYVNEFATRLLGVNKTHFNKLFG